MFLIIDSYPFRGRAKNKGSLLDSYQYVKHATNVMGGKPGLHGPGAQMPRKLDSYGTKYLLVVNPLDVAI